MHELEIGIEFVPSVVLACCILQNVLRRWGVDDEPALDHEYQRMHARFMRRGHLDRLSAMAGNGGAGNALGMRQRSLMVAHVNGPRRR